VSRLDPETGEVVATIKVSRGPMSLAVTPGTVWVVNFGGAGDSVTRIDAKTNQIVGEPIKTGRAPLSIAVGDGSVWVANHDARTVTRIDPETNQVVANIPAPSEPHRITFGEDQFGSLIARQFVSGLTLRRTSWWAADCNWFSCRQHCGRPGAYGHCDYRVDGDPGDVVVVRIDPQTNQVVETIPVGGHPIDVAVTEDAVWVSVQNPDMIVKINP
jgi:YVTN family beta-propeller protein